MHTSLRFAVAVHILTMLAQAGDEPLTSAYIAGSVHTNPVVIRRVLGLIRAQQLVESQPGAGGGWKLTRAPHAITLCEVYRAVEPGALLSIHADANPNCPVGRTIQATLADIFGAAQAALEDTLARSTIADVARGVLERSAR